LLGVLSSKGLISLETVARRHQGESLGQLQVRSSGGAPGPASGGRAAAGERDGRPPARRIPPAAARAPAAQERAARENVEKLERALEDLSARQAAPLSNHQA
jgi:hypothetical protein